MTLTHTRRHLATALACGLLLGGAACGGEPATKDAEPEAKAEPKPDPAPTPEPEPAPEPPAKTFPKTLASLDAAIEAAVELHSQHRRTFYCDCSYTPQLRIARGTCGYKTRADESLSKRVAWDRVVPNRAFGEHRACWREPICKDEAGVAFSGVRCCREVDEEFRIMELDLQNLVPAVGELQADRSDFDFGELDGEPRMYGACDFEVDRGQRRAEPAEDTRGDIARTYLYMHETYGDGLPLTAEEKARFEAWHQQDPPNAWEVQRNRRIAVLQGVSNSYVPMMAPAAGEEEEAPEPPAVEDAPAREPAPEEPPPPAEDPAPADPPAPAEDPAPAEPPPAEAPPT